MKQQIRLLGLDDSPFSFSDKYTTIIGVVMRGGEYLECVLSRQISIDGDDATLICIDMIKNTLLHVVKTIYNPIYIKFVGIDFEDAKKIIKLSTIRGVVPEPIRIAHL